MQSTLIIFFYPGEYLWLAPYEWDTILVYAKTCYVLFHPCICTCTIIAYQCRYTLLKNWDTNTHSVANESNCLVEDTLCQFANHNDVLLSILCHYVVGGTDGNTGVYKAAAGDSLTLAIVMLLALVFVIISVYMWHKHRGIGEKILSVEPIFHVQLHVSSLATWLLMDTHFYS